MYFMNIPFCYNFCDTTEYYVLRSFLHGSTPSEIVVAFLFQYKNSNKYNKHSKVKIHMIIRHALTRQACLIPQCIEQDPNSAKDDEEC